MTARAAVLITAVAGMLVAQAPAPPPLDALKNYLNLQDSQIQALQQLRQQEMQAIRPLATELAAKHQSLRDQLDRGSTDAAALGKLLLEAESVRKRLIQTRDSYHNQALNVLTAEQKNKLASLEQARKLAPVIWQAQALGLLAPPEPGEMLGPGLRGVGRGFGMMPGGAPGPGRFAGRRPAMGAPQRVPPLPQ